MFASATYATMLLAAAEAAEKEAPLIDIDGTVFVQFGIFLVMAGLLYALVFKPYLRVRDERTKGIEGARQEACELERRTHSMESDVESRMARAKQRGEQERMQLRAETAAYEQQVLGASRDAGNKAITESRARARAEEEAARVRLLAEVQPLAREIAGRVIGRSI